MKADKQKKAPQLTNNELRKWIFADLSQQLSFFKILLTPLLNPE